MATAKKNEEEVVETKQETKRVTRYIVSVKNNPKFCGVGAGGVQFANGTATITSVRMANWFKEHPGYDVKAE